MLPDPLHRALPAIVCGAVRVAPAILVIEDLVVGPRPTVKPPPRMPSPVVVFALRGVMT